MLVLLGGLCDWRKLIAHLTGSLLCVLDELVLLIEVFDCLLFPLHLGVLHLDASFEPNIFFCYVVVLLFQADGLLVELFVVDLRENRLLGRFPRLAVVLNHSLFRRMIRSSL